MTHIGIDIEQFIRDPYGSGIQRVLQQLAAQWPVDLSPADFVVPIGDRYAIVTTDQAADLLSLSFTCRDAGLLRERVADRTAELARTAPIVDTGRLLSLYSAWLLPEVSYLPSVLDRFELFRKVMPVSMIGYDALPMTEPANYRFKPGAVSSVSEYFRLLASADSVICISEYARDSILDRLRRDRSLPISVAHPGGDHIAFTDDHNQHDDHDKRNGAVRLLRVGTMEARKFPGEILDAFEAAVADGANLELVFIGAPSASDQGINTRVEKAAAAGIRVTWITDADDARVEEEMSRADIFLSIGTEGFGIPVLESIARGTPVAFAGIQPAADIMDGKGARSLEGLEHEELTRSFRQLADRSVIEDVRGQIRTEDIPKWRDFARGVCSGVLST